jgi:Homeodomain-like domain
LAGTLVPVKEDMPVAKKYVLKLAPEERATLEQLVKKGKAAGWKLQRAQALLKCDQGPEGPGWTDAENAAAFGCTTRSLESWRKQAVEQGPLSLLERKPRRPSVPPKLDGEKTARLVTLACSRPPQGRARWTLRLLAHRCVELKIVDAISYGTVRRALKKTS